MAYLQILFEIKCQRLEVKDMRRNHRDKRDKRSNQERATQLGMPFGTACNRLRKRVMFRLLCKLKENTCFRCGYMIESVDELSIEHKQFWMHSDDPVNKFFDLDNIAFSHLKCNTKRNPSRNGCYKPEAPNGQAWCSICKSFKIKSEFGPDSRASNGLRSRCNKCRKEQDWEHGRVAELG